MLGTKAASRFLSVLIILGFAACPGLQAQATATSGAEYRNAVEQETFLLINQYRKTNRLPALTWDAAIANEARGHSKDMATGEVDFGHEGFKDRIGRLKEVLTGLGGAGENVFMTSDLNQVAQSAVTHWLHSPRHLENIRGDYNYSGLGVSQGKDGTIYFTQIFVKVKPPTQAVDAEPTPAVVTPFGILASPETRSGR